MIDGREKGQRYMRDVCRLLDAWTLAPSGSFRPKPTVLTPLDGWSVKGDVSFPSTVRFPFVVECKNVEGWSLDALIEGRAKIIESWWEQCVRQAQASLGPARARIPLLIFSSNRRKNYFMAWEADLRRLRFKPVDPYLTVATPWGDEQDDRAGIGLFENLTLTTTPTPTRSPG